MRTNARISHFKLLCTSPAQVFPSQHTHSLLEEQLTGAFTCSGSGHFSLGCHALGLCTLVSSGQSEYGEKHFYLCFFLTLMAKEMISACTEIFLFKELSRTGSDPTRDGSPPVFLIISLFFVFSFLWLMEIELETSTPLTLSTLLDSLCRIDRFTLHNWTNTFVSCFS